MSSCNYKYQPHSILNPLKIKIKIPHLVQTLYTRALIEFKFVVSGPGASNTNQYNTHP